MIVGACCVAINAPCQGTKSLKSDRPGGPVGLEDLSRPADARQQPSHDSVVRLATAALKLVLLDGPFGEARGLICRLSLVLRKRHPLANDFPTRLVIFHVCGSLGCNFSTRLEATASFTVSRNSSGLVHAIRTASMWRASRFPPPECLIEATRHVDSDRGFLHDWCPIETDAGGCRGLTKPSKFPHIAETDCVAGHVGLEVRRETGKE